MAKKTKKTRVIWTKAHDKEMRKHSKAKTRVSKVAKLMKRTENAVRQRGVNLGIPMGHRR